MRDSLIRRLSGGAATGERGMALPISLVVLTIVGILVTITVVAATGGSEQAKQTDLSQLSRNAAENGVEAARAEISKNPQATLYDGGSDDSAWSSKSPSGGKTLTFGTDSTTKVSIRYVGGTGTVNEGEYEIKTSGAENGATSRLKASMFRDTRPGKVDAADDHIPVPYNSSQSLNVIQNDQGKDVRFSRIVTPPEESVAEVTCVSGGTEDGKCTATAARGATGSTSFIYEAVDVYGSVDTASVTVAIDPNTVRNDAPFAQADSDVADSGGYVVIPVLANDTDPDGDPLTIISNTNPARGSVECLGEECTYTAEDAEYTTTFTYRISDGKGHTAQATVTVVVSASGTNPAPPPDARDDPSNQSSGGTISTGYMQSALVPVFDNDKYDTATMSVATPAPSWGGGEVACSVARGGCSVKPEAGFDGIRKFTYRISDANGTDTAVVAIKVGKQPTVNHAPRAYDNGYSVMEGKSVTFNAIREVNASGKRDTDEDDDDLTMSSKTEPGKGDLRCQTDGKCTYTAAFGDAGATRSFRYTISDGHGGTASAVVTIRISAMPYTAVTGVGCNVSSPSHPNTDPSNLSLNTYNAMTIETFAGIERSWGKANGNSWAMQATVRSSTGTRSNGDKYWRVTGSCGTFTPSNFPGPNTLTTGELDNLERDAKRQDNYYNFRTAGKRTVNPKIASTGETVVFVDMGTAAEKFRLPGTVSVETSAKKVSQMAPMRLILVSRDSGTNWQ